MIQRIQTIYLLLCTVCLLLTYFFEISQYYVGDLTYEFSLNGISKAGGDMITDRVFSVPARYILPIVAVIPVFMILRFRNRALQIKIGRFLYLVILGFIVMMIFGAQNAGKMIPDELSTIKTLYWIGFYLPIAAITFLFLANRAIKKDDEMVKSLDRLR